MGAIKDILSGELWKLRKYRIWKTFLMDYKKDPVNSIKTFKIHRKGFSKADWEILELDKHNYRNYLTSKKYADIHPINGYYSKIIDDKMVIKYIFSGTNLGKYMPEYYYLIDESGMLCPMMDLEKSKDLSMENIYDLLCEKGKLAIKLVTGSIGKGFYKAEYRNGDVFINDEKITKQEFLAFLPHCRNYIVSEYLTAHPDIAEFWPYTANTIRYLAGRVDREWRVIKSFIRFGSENTGIVESFNRGGILCYINDDGVFDSGYILKHNGKNTYIETVTEHPQTHKTLKGKVPCWDQICKAAQEIEAVFPQTKYLGLDFVVTDKSEVKLLEINSLTSLDTMQLDKSILDTENGKWFFKGLL